MSATLESASLGFTLAFCAAALATPAFAALAGPLALLDRPGGRKTHAAPVPLVGGIAIFVALAATAVLLDIGSGAAQLLFALCIIIAAGLWDDVAEISPATKFAIQIAAASFMIGFAGIQLHGVGDLLGWRPIGLWAFSIPLTLFAVVGVVNAVNMMDGLDGLAGTIALASFAWFAAAAAGSGLEAQWRVALLFCGAIAGFLVFNLRLPWQPRARVFLGDAGSLMIGFALAWFAIDLTQGPGRAFPPICALWVVLLPLADCVSLMARRIARGCSPFAADREHIHHYLLARGYGHGRTVAMLALLSGAFGAVGYFGWRLAVPESLLFWPFFFGFFAYHFWIRAAWKKLEPAQPSRRAHESATEEPARMPG